jgi:hypothetical protein
MVVGTPEQVAADILHWIDTGAADGFNLNIDVQTEGLEDIVDQVIPILQKAGRFRRDYTGQTLRHHLGLAPYVDPRDAEPLRATGTGR